MSDYTLQKAATWSSLVGTLMFFFGLLIAGFLPLPPPSLTEQQVVAMYQGNTTAIRIGMLVMFIGSMFFCPFIAVISLQLRRIEGGSRLLAYTQLSTATIGTVFFLLPAVFFMITAYRPERPAELIYLMNDFSWITAIIVWPPFFMQNLSIGLAVLGDQASNPLFPRWFGFFQLWIAVLVAGGTLIPFFHEGPFAWSGIIAFWVPAFAFGTWIFVMIVMLLKAIGNRAYATVSDIP